jgi:hypothetical protein
VKKSEKKLKEQKNRLEFRFASFRFEAKITKLKQGEKCKAKNNENKQKHAKK